MKLSRQLLSLARCNSILICICTVIAVVLFIIFDRIWLALLAYPIVFSVIYLNVYGPLNHSIRHKLNNLVKNGVVEDSGISRFDTQYIKEIESNLDTIQGVAALGMHHKRCETGFTDSKIILNVIDMPFSNVYFIAWKNISKITKKSKRVNEKFTVLTEFTRDIYFTNGQKISIPLSDYALDFYLSNKKLGKD